MAVVGHGGKKVLLEVLDDHVVEEENNHYEIGLWGFDFNFLEEDKKEVGR